MSKLRLSANELVACTYDAHADAVLAIFNDVIKNSTALFEYRPRSGEDVAAWFEDKQTRGLPVIGAVESGHLLGFATYGTFRGWPAYKYSVEHSVYVERSHRRSGIGLALMSALIELAEQREVHTMIAGIDAENLASIALHGKLGFEHAGTIRQAGFKFGRWLDLVFYQRILRTPRSPSDD